MRSGFMKSFNLVIERLLISGATLNLLINSIHEFQSRYRAASHFRRVGIARRIGRNHRFNLVIERLLISGYPIGKWAILSIQVSISLSSGFSFQELDTCNGNPEPVKFQSRYRAASHFRVMFPVHRLIVKFSFNLVIERLLISGHVRIGSSRRIGFVSISLSSGFSFQVRRCGGERRGTSVSISLSSGFSFQA